MKTDIIENNINNKSKKIKIKNIYNYEYRLSILKQDGILKCLINSYNLETLKDYKYSFNLIEIIKKINIKKIDNDVYIKDNNYYESIFENNIKLIINKNFPVFINNIKNLIKSNPRYTIKDIQNIANEYNINPSYELIDENVGIYCCKDLSEIVYSMIHYLLDKNYKLNVCKYCERFMIVDSFKISYCEEISPFCYKYENKNCQYVKEERMHLLNSKRKTLDSKLFFNNYTNDEIYNYRCKCDMFKNKIKENPSVWNINDYEELLNKIENMI